MSHFGTVPQLAPNCLLGQGRLEDGRDAEQQKDWVGIEHSRFIPTQSLKL